MKKTMVSALSGLAMLVSACVDTQAKSTVEGEISETYDGFDITYSPEGFIIEGEVKLEENYSNYAGYGWRSWDNSNLLYLDILEGDAESNFRDEDTTSSLTRVFEDLGGDGLVETYATPELGVDLTTGLAVPFFMPEITIDLLDYDPDAFSEDSNRAQGVYEQHRRELPLQYAQEQWNLYWGQ